MKIRAYAFTSLAALALVLVCMPALAADGHLARLAINGDAIDWQPLTQNSYTLTVSGPNGFHFQDNFRSGDIASLSGLEDGEYAYEITPIVEMRARTLVQDNERGLAQVRAEIPSQAGHFRVANGAIASGGQEEAAVAPAAPQGGLQNTSAADQVILDDLIVDGSACIGQDCVNGESFGFDTLRLKENNLRIKFDDTSNSGSFPNVDWQLIANESDNGGANKFSIENVTSGVIPFTVRSGAGNNALYIDDQGDIGIATSTPVVELHIKDGDSPTIRLEQDGSSGFQSQTWDLAGNETNFFVRDVSNGSKLPFKIIPNAPTNSVYVNSNGDIGFGTASPNYDLHVINTSAGDHADLTLETASETWTIRSNANSSRLAFFRNDDSSVIPFFIDESAPADLMQVGFPNDQVSVNGQLNVNGNLVVSGTCTGCDAVFSSDFPLESIDEHAAFMFENSYLPAVGPTPEGPTQINVFEKTAGILQELEKAHIFIVQLSGEKKALQERLNRLEAQMEALLEAGNH